MTARLARRLLTIPGLVLLLAGAGAPPERPNVLLIMADDQGWGDVRCHGNPLIDTPTLDLLAGQGARFDRFFVSPVCAPTRASLLTGRYHLRTGTAWVTGGVEVMRPEEVTIAEALKSAGYATGIFGKWHNGQHYPSHPNGQGFDTFVGFCAGHWNDYFDPPLERNGEPFRGEGYITDVLTDHALAFIREHADEPFFCYVPYNAPHGPFQVPDRYFDKYKGRGCDDQLAAIYGMVENVDDNVGRLLAALDELGLAEDTIVLFLTDNGANSERYDGFMKGRKGSVHEGGSRVPLFVRWPGRIAPGTTVSQIAAHIDLMPTLLEFCGVAPPSGVAFDGVSLAPLLDGYEPDWPERFLFTHQYRRRSGLDADPGAVRTQRYRYVREGGRDQLFDLVADPSQERDLAGDLPDLTRELADAYDSWFRDVTAAGVAPFPIPVGHADRAAAVLPAPEADFSGGVRYYATHGWANDWLTGWDDADDRISWDLDVLRAGRYVVAIRYTCKPENVGARIRVEAGDESVEGTVTRPHDPDPMPMADRIPRGRFDESGHWNGEAPEMEWAEATLGAIRFEEGRQRLTLRAVEVPGDAAVDLKAVLLEPASDP